MASVQRFRNKLQKNKADLYSDVCCATCCETLQQGMTLAQLL